MDTGGFSTAHLAVGLLPIWIIIAAGVGDTSSDVGNIRRIKMKELKMKGATTLIINH